jgi:hypothetical protein
MPILNAKQIAQANRQEKLRRSIEREGGGEAPRSRYTRRPCLLIVPPLGVRDVRVATGQRCLTFPRGACQRRFVVLLAKLFTLEPCARIPAELLEL